MLGELEEIWQKHRDEPLRGDGKITLTELACMFDRSPREVDRYIGNADSTEYNANVYYYMLYRR